MSEFLRKILILPLLLMFLINVSGIGVCIEHSQHSNSTSAKLHQDNKETCIDNEDVCQCLLHMHMNQVLMPEVFVIDTPISSIIDNEMPQPKSINYRCLLDFFSSRAPPYLV